MNELQIFNNEEFGQVKTLIINNEPWFVGKDVANALGYGKGKSLNNAVSNHVTNEDKGVTEIMTPGGKQKTIIINESGLYALIFGSKLESAQRFKHWVTSEVLPSIRKTGGYVNDDELFVNTYLPFADDMTKQLFKVTLQTVRRQNEIIESQKERLPHKINKS
ncbi:BRO family protein [Clostridium sp. AM29-11AC]|uniref:BRO-N domain-containing protein n=1 Tax=Clostridium sp. AM29-11AC TaxID=2293028 RepID=UPI0026A9BA6C